MEFQGEATRQAGQAPQPDRVGKVAAMESGQTSERGDPSKATAAGQLVFAVVFGLAFGFLLQKGGVAKYHVLIGMMLLEDFTVAKVMLTAITVATVGLYVLNRLGLVTLQVPPTRFGANILGGGVFGVGFGLLAYCPGTNAAAAGQGNLDALVGVLGLLAGSYLFAMASGFLDRTVNKWGARGTLTLPQMLRIPPGLFIAVLTPVLVGALILMELATRR